MPAKSEKQREAMAIAAHNPSKLHAKNRGLLKMSKSQLHDYASTKGLSRGSTHAGIGARAPRPPRTPRSK